jgi:UDPglucose 6-dehydrogenase
VHRIVVVGAGHVGLVTAACFAELGNCVVCIDSDYSKIKALQSARLPFYEPGLRELVLRNTLAGRLSFSGNIRDGLHDADVIFITVGTPVLEDGSCDLSAVRQAAREVARYLDHDVVVVNKSTVPVETGDLLAAIVREHSAKGLNLCVVYNPEFSREGSSISDFMNPDRIVIGTAEQRAVEFMRDLYAPLNAPLLVTDVRTAEMIKCVSNAYLATRISFINEVAEICERVGADIKDVVIGVGGDKRIGATFLSAGLGFGGSCLPKDAAVMIGIAERCDAPSKLLPAVLAVNRAQIGRVLDKIDSAIGGLSGRLICVLGLSFKPGTDDVRESPALRLVEALLKRGCAVVAHDPAAIPNATAVLGNSVRFVDNCYDAALDVDAIVVATDWSEYKQLDLATLRALMRGDVIMDARNAYDPEVVLAHGFRYLSVGRAARAVDSARAPESAPLGDHV